VLHSKAFSRRYLFMLDSIVAANLICLDSNIESYLCSPCCLPGSLGDGQCGHKHQCQSLSKVSFQNESQNDNGFMGLNFRHRLATHQWTSQY
jgi:hypothetical protein